MSRDLKIKGYTVAQSPNPPLAVALISLVVALIVGSGTVRDIAKGIFFVAITIWAYEEAANGVNGFRKGLGITALVLIAADIARSLESQ